MQAGRSTAKLWPPNLAIHWRAGIDARVSPHDLRHDWATSAAAGGSDVFALRDAGGWASLNMPSRYVAAAKVANERVTLKR